MHHTDPAVDVTTALRFHPLEIALSLLIKSLVVWLLGAPVVAVLLFEVLLNGLAMFNHANLTLPKHIDVLLRKVVVTPDMHRVHHSVLGNEHNSNFGFNLSCWDRWFGSYIDQPQEGHQQMRLGLNETNSQPTGSLVWMLKQPFK
ncbi:putative sterol desaturase [gamma proteobacterium IMCC2047]|nr:putative sterol desaturase [gamma proteobacterium IMCC2047]